MEGPVPCSFTSTSISSVSFTNCVGLPFKRSKPIVTRLNLRLQASAAILFSGLLTPAQKWNWFVERTNESQTGRHVGFYKFRNLQIIQIYFRKNKHKLISNYMFQKRYLLLKIIFFYSYFVYSISSATYSSDVSWSNASSATPLRVIK